MRIGNGRAPELTTFEEPRIGLAWWSETAPALLEKLHSAPAGLQEPEVQRRLAAHGPNEIPGLHEAGRSAARALAVLAWRQVRSPLVGILTLGALLAMAAGEGRNAAMILLILLLTAALGCAQEFRADRAMDALRSRLALQATVRRAGAVRRVPVRELVPGDIVLLNAGNLVPGDGVLLESQDFRVVEASLTGEALPTEKAVGVSAPDYPLAERRNAVMMGTSVRSGLATVLLVHTGARTQVAQVAQSLVRPRPPSPFARGVQAFGAVLLRIMALVVAVALLANVWQGRPVLDALMFAVALAVGLSPELLPVIVSVTLARGAHRMAQGGAILRRLEVMEDLGSLDVLCTDKTGTLTKGQMALRSAFDGNGQPSRRVLTLACTNAALESGISNPLDEALGTAAQEHGLHTDPTLQLPTKRHELPYDFSRRRLSILVAEHGTDGPQTRLITKGATDSVLGLCSHWQAGDAAQAMQPLDDAVRSKLQALYERHSRDGLRLLAVATRVLPAEQTRCTADDERLMVFEGFVAFEDPPKADAREALQALAERGVSVKVITGDNRHVAIHVAQAVGLNAGGLLTGAELQGLSDEALWHRARHTTVFAEVDPQQKARIVRALQRGGLTVGYLGDGINDAPALYAADVGISVDGAVDVARESADAVLTRPDLALLARAIDEGRRTFANTRKYMAITASANFGNMISLSLGSWLLPFVPMGTQQILLNNLLSDGPALALADDAVDADQMRRAQHWDMAQLQRFMWVFGLISTGFDLLVFGWLHAVLKVGTAEFQTAWFLSSLFTELLVLMLLRTAGPSWRSRPGTLLLSISAGMGLLALLLTQWPPSAQALGFAPLGAPAAVSVLVLVGAYALVTEGVKLSGWVRPA